MDKDKELGKSSELNRELEIDYREKVNNPAIKMFILILFLTVIFVPIFIIINLIMGKPPFYFF